MQVVEFRNFQLVGYYCSVNSKWIRCEVDDVTEYNTGVFAFLWAIDYGFPFYTKKFSNLVPLSDDFKFPRSMIFAAGLPVMPAKVVFDHIEVKQVNKVGESWTERAMKTFIKRIKRNGEIYFVPSANVSHHKVTIGDLHVGRDDRIGKGLAVKLVKENLAVKVPDADFEKSYSNLLTNVIERWNDYKRFGGSFKEPEDIFKSLIIENPQKLMSEVSSIGKSHREIINQKVADWNLRNEDSFAGSQASLSEQPSRFERSQMRMKNFWLSKTLSHAATKSDDVESISMTNLNLNSPKRSSSTSKRETIIVPAGASLAVALAKRAKEQKISTASRISGLTFDDDQFVSVSQVGCDEDQVFDMSLGSSKVNNA